ncbi:MAG: recombinase family protein [Treponema sp.]|nr:recombinase family protein [Treponema sp.]
MNIININGAVYGYVRVSSVCQNEARQLLELQGLGIAQENIFVDKSSGKDFNRTQYQCLKRLLNKDDILVVKSIDRFGRNYSEIIEEWRYLTKNLGVDIVVLDMPLLDTRNGKDLLGTLISDIVLQILSYVAETERNQIRQRQKEGIAIAKSKGIHFGRPEKSLPESFDKVLEEFNSKALTRKQAADKLGINVSRFDYLRRKLEN